jgi:hypothetical protein
VIFVVPFAPFVVTLPTLSTKRPSSHDPTARDCRAVFHTGAQLLARSTGPILRGLIYSEIARIVADDPNLVKKIDKRRAEYPNGLTKS